MDFLSLAKRRHSTSQFLARKVDGKKLRRILEAARWSPSFLNLQPWEFVIVTKRQKIEALLKAAYYGMYSYAEQKNPPPMLVAIVLKKKYWEGEYGYPRRDKPGIFEAYLSIAMPALAMALAAEELGIGSRILNVNEHVAARELGLTGGDSAPLVVCLGYEKQKSGQKNRKRKSLKELLHYENYGHRG
ncbi:MAG: nitroreductase family protein [Candidatus Micrarchaeota archaeon]|nr:nitroreductase family protein [Candidatus Micrarchaeota archaeon]